MKCYSDGTSCQSGTCSDKSGIDLSKRFYLRDVGLVVSCYFNSPMSGAAPSQ